MIKENNLIPGSSEKGDNFFDIFKLIWEVSGTERESNFWAFLGEELRNFRIIEEDGIEEESTLDTEALENLATLSITYTHEDIFPLEKGEYLDFIFRLDMDSE